MSASKRKLNDDAAAAAAGGVRGGRQPSLDGGLLDGGVRGGVASLDTDVMECVLRFFERKPLIAMSHVCRTWRAAATNAAKWQRKHVEARAQDEQRAILRAHIQQVKLTSAHMSRKAADRIKFMVDGPYMTSCTCKKHKGKILRGFIGFNPLLEDLNLVSLCIRRMHSTASDYDDAPDQGDIIVMREIYLCIVNALAREGTAEQIHVLVECGVVAVLAALVLEYRDIDDVGEIAFHQDLLAMIVHSSQVAQRQLLERHFVVVERAMQPFVRDNDELIASNADLLSRIASHGTGEFTEKFRPFHNLWVKLMSSDSSTGVEFAFHTAASLLVEPNLSASFVDAFSLLPAYESRVRALLTDLTLKIDARMSVALWIDRLCQLRPNVKMLFLDAGFVAALAHAIVTHHAPGTTAEARASDESSMLSLCLTLWNLLFDRETEEVHAFARPYLLAAPAWDRLKQRKLKGFGQRHAIILREIVEGIEGGLAPPSNSPIEGGLSPPSNSPIEGGSAP